MRIGELATAVNLPPETVRFYEKRGLLPEPQRSPNGYRSYDNQTIARIAFIQSAKAAGLTLEEIRSILALRADGTAPCGHVEGLLVDKLTEVRERQRRLADLEAELGELIERSRTLDPTDCSPDDVCHILTDASAVAGRPRAS